MNSYGESGIKEMAERCDEDDEMKGLREKGDTGRLSERLQRIMSRSNRWDMG